MDSGFALPLFLLTLAALGALLVSRSWRRSRELEALRAELKAANETLSLRAESLQRVLHASSELKAHLPIEAVLANVARAAATGLGGRRVPLSIRDRTEGTLVPRAHVGFGDEWAALSAMRLPADRVAGTARGALPPSPLASILPEPARASFVAVPLLADDHLVGLLELEEPELGESDPGDRKTVVELFAGQAVTAIRLARAYETMRLGSLRDPLTGLANHGHFQQTLYREITRHGRHGAPLVLLMADLDDFKSVNDRHGHPAGDAVLKAAVATLLSSVREMDTVARYGGEEFAVILPETDAPKGLGGAERLRASLASTPFHAGLPEPLRLTLSIGLAVYPDDASAKGALIECADRALYAAKKTGKNRVVRVTPPSTGA